MTVTPVTVCSTAIPPNSSLTLDGDTWISRIERDLNFGAAPDLSLLTTLEGKRTLVHFAVPGSISVNTATLYLYVSAADAGMQVFVYGLTGTGPFLENEITWNKRNATTEWLPYGGAYDVSKYVIFEPIASASGCWYSLDITGFVKDWVNTPAKNQGLILIAHGPDGLSATVSSKENSEPLNAPRIVVEP
jgi:hypothetical protein